MTQQEIFQIIKADNIPIWTLYAINGYTKQHVGSYNNEAFEEADENTKIEKSIEALQQRLSLLEDTQNFFIKLKRTIKSNQDGIFEYYFQNTLNNKQKSNQLSGIPEIPIGYVPENLLEKERQLLKKETENAIKTILKEQELKNKIAAIKRKKREIEEQQKKFNDKTELLSGAIETVFYKYFGKILPIEQLNGIDETNNNDERAVIVEKIAQKLYEDKKIKTSKLYEIFKNISEPEPEPEPREQTN